VLVGSSNDYCGVYNNGVDAFGAPIPSGPIWLGLLPIPERRRIVPKLPGPRYPEDTSPYAGRAQVRTATAGDPVLAWGCRKGGLFAGAESVRDPAGTKKTFGDRVGGNVRQPRGAGGANESMTARSFCAVSTVARGTSAPDLLGKFQDKTAIEADRTTMRMP
jgi:hypothetical protein